MRLQVQFVSEPCPEGNLTGRFSKFNFLLRQKSFINMKVQDLQIVLQSTTRGRSSSTSASRIQF